MHNIVFYFIVGISTTEKITSDATGTVTTITATTDVKLTMTTNGII